MPTDISDIISKLSVKEIGEHLKNYTDLYLKPTMSWKKAFSQRKEGYDFVILNIIYYAILVLLILQDFYFTIQLVILEVVITLYPILIFYIPFKICTSAFNIHKNWNKLFRTFLIIKFQIIPPMVLLLLIAKWSDFEPIFIIIENAIWAVWLSFIFAIPVIVSIKLWKRIIWILLNYIFFLIGISVFAYAITKLDSSDSLSKKLALNTPNLEYINVCLQDSLTLQKVIDDNYLAILNDVDTNYFKILDVQFVTPVLSTMVTKNSKNRRLKNWRIRDSIRASLDSTHIQESLKHKIDYDIKDLNIASIDSFRTAFNEQFYHDLQLYKAAKDSSKYKSNKKYFTLYHDYLSYYNDLLINPEKRKDIVTSQIMQVSYALDENQLAVLYQLDSAHIFPSKNKLIEMEEKLENRWIKSNFLLNIIFYPIDLFYDKLNIN